MPRDSFGCLLLEDTSPGAAVRVGLHREGPVAQVRDRSCAIARPGIEQTPFVTPSFAAVLASHPARHLLRARDLVDARYREPLDVKTLARAAKLSPAHFSREFRREFGESPHQYLLMRRLERAASLLRTTDRTVADICLTVGLRSVGSFTTSFHRTFGMTPTEYRAAHPPAALRVRIPTCVQLAWARPETARLEKTAG